MTSINTLLLRRIKMFAELTESEISSIINAPENGVEEFLTKDNIFHEGHTGEHMYVVLHGVVEIYVSGEFSDAHGKRETCIATMREGEYFGETAALQEGTARRTATARAASPCTVFRIHKKYVLEAARNVEDLSGRYPPDEVRDTVLKLAIFKGLNRDEIHNIRDWTEVVSGKAGDFIYKAGGKAASMYVILGGRIELLTLDDSGKPVVTASQGPGEFFGETALLPTGHGHYHHFARAVTDCRLIRIPKHIFDNLLARDATLPDTIKMVQNLRELKLKNPRSGSEASLKS